MVCFVVVEQFYPEEENLERVLSYLSGSLPREELRLFLGEARPLAQSLSRYDSSAMDDLCMLVGTTLYRQLRRDNCAPLEAYLVFADCYALVDAPAEEKRILLEKGMREYLMNKEVREEMLRELRELTKF